MDGNNKEKETGIVAPLRFLRLLLVNPRRLCSAARLLRRTVSPADSAKQAQAQ